VLLFALGAAVGRDATRLDAAVEWLERALEAGIESPARVHLELGEVELRRQRPAEALDHLLVARSGLAEAPSLWTAIAAAQRALGDAAAAESAENRAAELRGRLEQRSESLGGIRSAMERAQAALEAGRANEALSALDTVREAGSGVAAFHAMRGQVLFALRRGPEALDAARRARALDPGAAEFAYFEGLFLLASGRAAEAEPALRAALALDGSLAQAEGLLGGALAKLGRDPEAVTHFERALELGLDDPEIRLGYADVLRKVGRGAESEEQLRLWRLESGSAR